MVWFWTSHPVPEAVGYEFGDMESACAAAEGSPGWGFDGELALSKADVVGYTADEYRRIQEGDIPSPRGRTLRTYVPDGNGGHVSAEAEVM